MLFKNTYDPIIFHDVSTWARVTFAEKEIEELKKFKLAKDFFFSICSSIINTENTSTKQ